ncbi:MAG TPA: hypothetical protein DCX22_01340 [Dehalococcoidia bacterium]|nr:hypothetical protein [Dehalococcoidia bacterium]
MKVVLHICCGICAAGTAQTLQSEGHDVIGFFCNSNIHPRQEYIKRLEVARIVSDKLGFSLHEAPYTPDEWLEATAALKNEPEGGKRCELCFRIRLQETYAYLQKCGADAFTTTLTISPHKPATIVNAIGEEIAGDLFLQRDFKKKEGFKKAMQQAREWELYRQDYCGCLYSIRSDRQ